jgi:hypothetical protein
LFLLDGTVLVFKASSSKGGIDEDPPTGRDDVEDDEA